ncbi:MAG TPA: mechanosensitive ion channel family protein, partial [Candidatus Aquilonibacter sp.]|nr:mechanosensitive ion channel family protein [Candidatus Aquilonibacter sp.]
LLLLAVLVVMRRRIRTLKRQADERQQSMQSNLEEASGHSGDEAEHSRRRALALGMRAAQPEQRIARLSALSGIVIWLIVVLWVGGITWSLLLFPQTTAVGQFIMSALGRILAVWLVAGIVDRLLQLAIVHFADLYAHHGTTSEERARHALRAPTISRAIGGFKTAMIFFVAVLATLSQLQIPIASVVTIGGIAALAIGFAAQAVVRDVLNGLLVLTEDQYVVGDYVMIGDYNGIVENLTLRVVQLRDTRGYLITIPHSAVVQVVNASRNWARIDYRIAVDPAADVKKAVDVLRNTLEEIGCSDAWRDAVIEPVEWVGVEYVANNGIVLRASIRTAPLRQFDLRRVINAEVADAFRDAGIVIGVDPIGNPVPPVQGSPNPL